MVPYYLRDVKRDPNLENYTCGGGRLRRKPHHISHLRRRASRAIDRIFVSADLQLQHGLRNGSDQEMDFVYLSIVPLVFGLYTCLFKQRANA